MPRKAILGQKLVHSQHFFVVTNRDMTEIDSDYDQVAMYNLLHKFWKWKIQFSPLGQK